MKKLLSLSAGILFAGFMTAQAIPNGGFENWSNLSWYDLNNYENSNDQYIAQGFGLAGLTAIRATPGISGNYALEVKTIQIGADTLFGYATNSYKNPLQGKGGIPWGATNPMPTGISFYYQCSVQLHDTSGVIILFKKSGSIIGTYLFPFIGNVGTYTLFSNAFVPALSQTPDTVIFAAISSIAAAYDNNNTKGCLPGTQFIIDSVKFTGAGVANPARFNGNFENWTSDTLYAPIGWNALYPGSFEANDAYAGIHATQLTTTIPSYNGGSPSPGIISTGNIQNADKGGYAYSLTTDTLEFYYKYAPAHASGDQGIVELNFIKNGSSISNSTMNLPASASYTLFKFGFGPLSPAPDTVIVTFGSSNSGSPTLADVGSVLTVDNAFFKSQQSADLGINGIAVVEGIKIYPNPVTNSFNLNTEGFTGLVESVEVYDMMGRAVLSENYASGLDNTITSFDMSKTSPGIYIVRVLTSTGAFYQKISKVQKAFK